MKMQFITVRINFMEKKTKTKTKCEFSVAITVFSLYLCSAFSRRQRNHALNAQLFQTIYGNVLSSTYVSEFNFVFIFGRCSFEITRYPRPISSSIIIYFMLAEKTSKMKYQNAQFYFIYLFGCTKGAHNSFERWLLLLLLFVCACSGMVEWYFIWEKATTFSNVLSDYRQKYRLSRPLQLHNRISIRFNWTSLICRVQHSGRRLLLM